MFSLILLNTSRKFVSKLTDSPCSSPPPPAPSGLEFAKVLKKLYNTRPELNFTKDPPGLPKWEKLPKIGLYCERLSRFTSTYLVDSSFGRNYELMHQKTMFVKEHKSNPFPYFVLPNVFLFILTWKLFKNQQEVSIWKMLCDKQSFIFPKKLRRSWFGRTGLVDGRERLV